MLMFFQKRKSAICMCDGVNNSVDRLSSVATRSEMLCTVVLGGGVG